MSLQDKFNGLQQRPYEPLFIPKNEGELLYDLPVNFLTERYREIGPNLMNRFGAAGLIASLIGGVGASGTADRSGTPGSSAAAAASSADGSDAGGFGAAGFSAAGANAGASSAAASDAGGFGAAGFGPSNAYYSPPVPQANRVALNAIQEPDLKFAEVIPRRGEFSLFIPEHRRIAGRLIELFLEQPDAEKVLSVAAFARDRLNAIMFHYALSIALLHRTDTIDIKLNSLLFSFPDRFVDPAIFPTIQEEGNALLELNRMSLDIPMNYTASEQISEQRLAYFREDIGVNLYHWQWHVVYPSDGPDRVVRKDRRGELFYYMHQQLLARYQIERYSQGLGNVTQLNNLRDPIPEPYYPKIMRYANNRTYSARYENMTMEDVQRNEDRLLVVVDDVERQLQRIVEAIDAGVVVSPNGKRIQLDNFRGIDVLGNILESSTLSVNRELYGDTNNSGHILLSFIHDPREEFLESFGVMGDVATAMRDPVFYRWHTYVNNLLVRHKLRLAPYVAADLSNPGVKLMSLETRLDQRESAKNVLVTFWKKTEIELGTRCDFVRDGSVFAKFTHLQHAPFNFQLQVSYSGQAKPATVRIFLAPKRNESGTLLTFEKQRRLAIEMDRFRVKLLPGINNINRSSKDSSITIPYKRTLGIEDETYDDDDYDEDAEFNEDAELNEDPESNKDDESSLSNLSCDCGWPSHMLVPKGNTTGVEYDLFAMLSDYRRDRVDTLFDKKTGCDDAHSICGLGDRKYPDARNMGFPFDRRVPDEILSFQDFVAPYQNMRVATVTIRFSEEPLP